MLHQVAAEAVAQVAVIGHRQHDQIGLFARLQRADALAAPDRRGSVDGGSRHRLRRGQPQVAAGQRDDELHILAPGRAGVEVRGQRQQPARRQDLPRGRVVRLGQAERRAGQRHRHCAAGGQRGDVGG